MKRVLLVEDEILLSMVMEDSLGSLGYEVVTASSLTAGLEHARTLELDVALLDVNLAGTLSYPIAVMLLGRNIPFVFASGYDELVLPEPMRNVPVLAKPFRTHELDHALRLVMIPTP
ncbi:response regulator [Lichenicola sp.]|uniref:response regulator n=1 Tax=Lichenicola sp. TaxID=2804529 RepID=UPI003B00E43F